MPAYDPHGKRTGIAPADGCPSRRLRRWVAAGMADWPGRVATTVLLHGCSFRCPYCSEPSGVEVPDDPCGWDTLLDHLGAKRSWLDGVVVSGGEPTEDPDLPSLLARLSDEGIPVKLDTNGARPEMLAYLLAEDLVDCVALDIKAPFDRYDALTCASGSGRAVALSAELLLSSSIDYEFRTTLYPGAISMEDLPGMARSIKGGRLYGLQRFRPEVTLEKLPDAVEPFEVGEVRAAAQRCRAFLPTVLRGFKVCA